MDGVPLYVGIPLDILCLAVAAFCILVGIAMLRDR